MLVDGVGSSGAGGGRAAGSRSPCANVPPRARRLFRPDRAHRVKTAGHGVAGVLAPSSHNAITALRYRIQAGPHRADCRQLAAVVASTTFPSAGPWLSPRCARSAPAGNEGVSGGGPVMDLDVPFSPWGILSIEASPISR